jgi:predicted N-acyltransferase
MDRNYKLFVYDSISGVDKYAYNTIIDRENPFLEYEFLEAMEKSCCVGPNTAWKPRHIIVRDGDRIAGAVTAYVKFDSYGEYIFDWEWARAFENAGLNYYPKMVVAIPYTPATGMRISVHPEYGFEECALMIVNRLIDLCAEEKCSSVHFLFLTEKESIFLENSGFLTRITHQYHWRNRNYKVFEDFLSDIRSGRKKQIRKERKSLEEAGLDIRIIEKDDIKSGHIDAIWEFYTDTHSRKWGSAYLNREFFELIFENYRHRLVLVLADNGKKCVGGTFNIVKNNRLFGRYWGTTHNYKNLHFECCLYRLIDYSIRNGIDIFEAGAQGEHKFLRGFAAVPTYSSHFIMHKGASNAIGKHLIKERKYTGSIIDQYNAQSPLKYLHREHARSVL